ncbi:AAA family ATPase [Polymorphospora sp. 2-325]|uniref:AAA family ATPase n=1 Tax=Polymorphospora lycopeni TaxID=3140240 RepID=A0ABV5CIN6_9ACTN
MQKSVLRGRSAARRTITDLIDAAATGTGGALLLHGELGLGKTALLDDGSVTAAAHPAGFTVLAAKGLPDEADLPYAVLHRLLEPLAGRIPPLPGRQGDVLTRALGGEGCPEPDRLVLCRAVLGLLGTAGTGRPLFCRLDDTHAADPPSLDVLAFAARRLRPYRVAMVLAGDAAEAVCDVPALGLTPLDETDSLGLLGDLVPDGLPADTAAALARLARGNPQALTDLATTLTPAQRYGDEPPPTALPPDGVLGRSYRDRLRRLPAETRWLLLLAAADEALDQFGLVRAAEASGTRLTALAPAELAGLIRVDAHRVGFPQRLLRTLAYQQAPLARRSRPGGTRRPDPRRRPPGRLSAATAPDPGLPTGTAGPAPRRAPAPGPDHQHRTRPATASGRTPGHRRRRPGRTARRRTGTGRRTRPRQCPRPRRRPVPYGRRPTRSGRGLRDRLGGPGTRRPAHRRPDRRRARRRGRSPARRRGPVRLAGRRPAACPPAALPDRRHRRGPGGAGPGPAAERRDGPPHGRRR